MTTQEQDSVSVLTVGKYLSDINRIKTELLLKGFDNKSERIILNKYLEKYSNEILKDPGSQLLFSKIDLDLKLCEREITMYIFSQLRMYTF